MARPLAAGDLRRRVTIEQQTTTQDAAGQQQTSWTPLRSCWANIRNASSKDVYAAAGFVCELSLFITVRYTAQPISSAMRVSYGSRTFQVQAVVDPDEANVVLQLMCLERDA